MSIQEQIAIIQTRNEFTVIDIETSGLSPTKGGMIIELAAVKIRDGKIVEKRSQLINPERKLTKKIVEITGITDEMLVGKPTFREVLPKFYEFIGNSVIVAHNASFDWERYMKYFLPKVGIVPTNDVVDTLVLSKMYLKNDDKKYSLGYLCEMVNIELVDAHRALADTYATAKLFLHIKNTYIGDSKHEQVSLISQKEASVPAKAQEIRNISYWKKSWKNTTFERIYVTLERSVVFFDIPSKAWQVKDSNESIDFGALERDIFSKNNLSNIDEFISCYRKKGA